MEVIQAMVRQALTGDVKAAALLMAYGYGKPKETVEVDAKHEHYVVIAPEKEETIDAWERSHSPEPTE